MMYENENVHELNMVTNEIKVLDTFCEIILIYCEIINSSPFHTNIMHNFSSGNSFSLFSGANSMVLRKLFFI